MSEIWHPWFHRFCNVVYFDRISVLHAERLPPPDAGPVLYLGLHRNGAVDGFVYHGLLPRAVFMISTQLRRSWMGRMFFCGIEVVRDKDRSPDGASDQTNAAAMQGCGDLLGNGGELFVFPEGTSCLGPQHLPFKSGAARLLNEHLARGRPITVVPLGIHYQCPWEFRSRVEVVVGAPISTDLTGCETPLERLKQLKRRIQSGLEEVGVNVATVKHQLALQRFASGATLGTSRSYFATMKAWEKEIPPHLTVAWEELASELAMRRLACHQEVPLYPLRPVGVYVMALGVMAPVVVGALLANAPAVAAAGWAGRRISDERNVISLWRLLVGMPVFLLWVVVVGAALVLSGNSVWAAAYALLTLAGLKLYHRMRTCATAVYNAIRYPEMRAPVLAFRERLLEALP